MVSEERLRIEREALLILEDALDLPESRRDSFIAGKTADESVKARVAAMLAADRVSSLRTGAATLGLDAASLPERIGAYRVTAVIGRGGMGVVYAAERDAGDFAREVAIKLVKPGLLSDELAGRLAVERQVLAGLAHPNIARLYDGGTTAGGQPFIVMEKVDGEPIDRFADRRGLDGKARVALVAGVADAVAHAHRRLIIHRDITPLNVLVTDEGVSKLIDFGIARGAEEATTAVDVAGLGRLLRRLVPEGDAELQAIIARATAAGEAERYPTAEAFAADLAAWQTGNPVAAFGGGQRYRVGKFVRRNRLAVGLAGLALVALVGGLTISALQWQRAEAARAAEAVRFDEVRTLARYLLFDLNDRLHRLPGATDARADLATKAQTYLSRLAATDGARADVRLETARGLIRLAQIQGSPVERNLGDLEQAQRNLAAADDLLEALVAEGVAAATVERARVAAIEGVMAVHAERDGDRGTRRLQAAKALIDGMPNAARDAHWHLARRDVGRAEMELLALKEELDALALEAAAHERRVAGWPAPLAGSLEARIEQAYARYNRGLVESIKAVGDHGAGDLLAALAMFEAAERERPGDPELLYMIGWSGLDAYAAAERAGRQADGIPALEAGAVAIERLAAADTADDSVDRLYRNLGETRAQHLSNVGRSSEAIAAQRRVIARTEMGAGRTAPGRHAADLGFNHMILGLIAKKAGDRALTCESWAEARRLFGAAEREGALIGFHAGFVPGIEANLARCSKGAPLAAMRPLR